MRLLTRPTGGVSRPKAFTCLLPPSGAHRHLGSMPTALWPFGHCSGRGWRGGGAEAEAVNFVSMCPWGEGALPRSDSWLLFRNNQQEGSGRGSSNWAPASPPRSGASCLPPPPGWPPFLLHVLFRFVTHQVCPVGYLMLENGYYRSHPFGEEPRWQAAWKLLKCLACMKYSQTNTKPSYTPRNWLED